ncbi:Regulatory protein SoxS [Phycisphaerae bacterium RAS1]|nr:Regulatory protein SoxS [Phycisphaerae bacterium RAS1]
MKPGPETLPPASRPVYEGRRVSIGMFRCPPHYPHWTRPSEAEQRPFFVFPRVPVQITHVGERPLVADAARVMFYNRAQIYTRRALCERGDECEWFAVEPAAMHEAVTEFDAFAPDDPMRPFRLRCGQSDARMYLRQRRLFNLLRSGAANESLAVEEAVFGLMRGVIALSYGFGVAAPAGDMRRAASTHEELVEAIRALLATQPGLRWTLDEIASRVGRSPYHICRVFRERSGSTIHACLTQLRLHLALEALERPDTDLASLALELGFSNHAHFTSAFRRAFGVCPSSLRGRIGAARRRAARAGF